MAEIIIFTALGFTAGYFYGYRRAMLYCTRKLTE